MNLDSDSDVLGLLVKYPCFLIIKIETLVHALVHVILSLIGSVLFLNIRAIEIGFSGANIFKIHGLITPCCYT